jgi:sortase A
VAQFVTQASLRNWRTAEITAWMVGFVCLAVWTHGRFTAEVGRREAIGAFYHASPSPRFGSVPAPDQSLWSPQRVRAWEQAQAQPASATLGILRIPRIRVEVPIFEGTDDRVLDRGAGHIEDTSIPGERGNSGIAGHRDGFFRPLKEVRAGDELEIETTGGTARYRVERTLVVDPEDVSVLDPTPTDAVTLVTCYPFYFVGSAPQRFIVRAVRTVS